MKTTTEATLDQLRADFERETNRSIALPVAGMIIWALIGVASLFLEKLATMYVMLFASGAIFPLGLLIAKIRKENVLSSNNPLAKLMGMSVLMVNLLWAVHIPLVIYMPVFVALSLGIGLGLHWIVYSWIIQHKVGVIHAVSRTVLIVAAWFLVPEARTAAISLVIVIVYAASIYMMLNRPLNTVPE